MYLVEYATNKRNRVVEIQTFAVYVAHTRSVDGHMFDFLNGQKIFEDSKLGL